MFLSSLNTLRRNKLSYSVILHRLFSTSKNKYYILLGLKSPVFFSHPIRFTELAFEDTYNCFVISSYPNNKAILVNLYLR